MAASETKLYQFLDFFTSIDEKLDVMTTLLRKLVEKPATATPVIESPPRTIEKIDSQGREQTEEISLAEAVIELNNSVLMLNDLLNEEFKSYDSYLLREKTVKKGSSEEFEVANLLGRSARRGYLISDDGEIEFDINEQKDFTTLKNGEQIDFDNLRLEVNKLKVQTTSDTELNFRLFLV